jgi:predicted amidohydrolase
VGCLRQRELVAEARNGDIARAIENHVAVVRADVAGRNGDLMAYGTSGIVNRNGAVLGLARELEADIVVATIKTVAREPRPGWDASRNPAVADQDVQLVTRAYAKV